MARSHASGQTTWPIVAAVLLAVVCRAEPVPKWRAPDGTLYFGHRPPAGSEPLGEVGSLEPLGTEAPPESAAPDGRRIRQERAAARAEARARRARLARAVEVGTVATTRGAIGWLVVGTVRNTADEPVHRVRVGAGGEWVDARPPTIAPGAEASFRLEVPMFPRSDADVLPPIEVDWRERR